MSDRGWKHRLEYSVWSKMNDRCYRPRAKDYSHYGARGIVICERWRGKDGFKNFLADMGPRPSRKYTLDRIDNDKGYEPDNCRWATRLEQTRNRRGYATETHCRRGHEFTAASAYFAPSGKRGCRICRRLSERNRRRNETNAPA